MMYKTYLYLRRLQGCVEEHVQLVVGPVLGVVEEEEVGDAQKWKQDEGGANCFPEVRPLRGGGGVDVMLLQEGARGGGG